MQKPDQTSTVTRYNSKSNLKKHKGVIYLCSAELYIVSVYYCDPVVRTIFWTSSSLDQVHSAGSFLLAVSQELHTAGETESKHPDEGRNLPSVTSYLCSTSCVCGLWIIRNLIGRWMTSCPHGPLLSVLLQAVIHPTNHQMAPCCCREKPHL